MIKILKNDDTRALTQFLRVQKKAYRCEADLLGCATLPPLEDTVASLRNSRELLLAASENNRIVGGIGLHVSRTKLEVCRLFVHPNHFRRNIGSRLLVSALRRRGVTEVRVSTAKRNEPAVALYRKFGFQVVAQKKVGDGLVLVSFKKRLKAAPE